MLRGTIEHLSQTTDKNPYKSKIIALIKYLLNTDLNFFVSKLSHLIAYIISNKPINLTKEIFAPLSNTSYQHEITYIPIVSHGFVCEDTAM